MKKLFLLLSVTILSFFVFCFCLVSVAHPMGAGVFMGLVVLGAIGLWAFCESVDTVYDICRDVAAQRLLRRRIQGDKLFNHESCRQTS